MRVVLTKPTPDFTQLSLSLSQGRVFEKGKRVLNPYDARALAAALGAEEVVALAFGTPEDENALRTALAMGAARAVLLTAPNARELDSAQVAWVLADAIRGLGDVSTVFAGERAEPGQLGTVPARVAEELARQLAWHPDAPPGGVVIVPATAAEAKLPSALAIMKAARKPLEVRPAQAPPFGPILRPLSQSLAPGGLDAP